jgi:hypothetical protein
MARETIKCPNCECKVLLSDVEKEDGLCPECGQMVQSSNLFSDYDDEDYDFDLDDNDENEFDDDDFDDDFDDIEFDEEDDHYLDQDADTPRRPGRKKKKYGE